MSQRSWEPLFHIITIFFAIIQPNKKFVTNFSKKIGGGHSFRTFFRVVVVADVVGVVVVGGGGVEGGGISDDETSSVSSETAD
jgi:hypothetical protein